MSELIAAILECSKPAVLPAPWNFLQPVRSVRQIVDARCVAEATPRCIPRCGSGRC